MRASLALASASAALLVDGSVAGAEGASRTAWDAHPFAAHAVAGFPGGPLGLLGAEVTLSPTARLGATLGAGVGLNSDAEGSRAVPRFAAAAGYRFSLDDSLALGAWLSGSLGSYRERDFKIESGVETGVLELDRAYWVGAAFVAERRFPSGLSFQFRLGLEYLVNASDAHCYAEEHGTGVRRGLPCERVDPLTLSPFFPALALAGGYAF